MGRPRSSNLFTIALVLLLFGALQVDALASDVVGHVYMQTNESQNRIMHFGRNADGQLELGESIRTGGRWLGRLQADQRSGERAQRIRGRW
jgi:hypothetical protein